VTTVSREPTLPSDLTLGVTGEPTTSGNVPPGSGPGGVTPVSREPTLPSDPMPGVTGEPTSGNVPPNGGGPSDGTGNPPGGMTPPEDDMPEMSPCQVCMMTETSIVDILYNLTMANTTLAADHLTQLLVDVDNETFTLAFKDAISQRPEIVNMTNAITDQTDGLQDDVLEKLKDIIEKNTAWIISLLCLTVFFFCSTCCCIFIHL